MLSNKGFLGASNVLHKHHGLLGSLIHSINAYLLSVNNGFGPGDVVVTIGK
jgi:hypothetical protein